MDPHAVLLLCLQQLLIIMIIRQQFQFRYHTKKSTDDCLDNRIVHTQFCVIKATGSETEKYTFSSSTPLLLTFRTSYLVHSVRETVF